MSTVTSEKKPLLVRSRTQLGRVLFLVILPVLLFFQHRWSETSFLDYALNTIGFVLITAGVLVRLWCTLYIGGKKDSTLQTSGPYSMVRHPLYFGSLLIGFGVSAYSENPIMLGLILIYFAIQYRVTIRHEEEFLTSVYGTAYTEYMQRVPRLFPSFKRFDPSSPDKIKIRPLWREVIRGSIALTLIPLLNLIAILHEHGVLPFVKFP